MADYKTMYHKLFSEMNDTIDRFKTRLLEVENIYIETDLEAYQKDEQQRSYRSLNEAMILDGDSKKIDE